MNEREKETYIEEEREGKSERNLFHLNDEKQFFPHLLNTFIKSSFHDQSIGDRFLPLAHSLFLLFSVLSQNE